MEIQRGRSLSIPKLLHLGYDFFYLNLFPELPSYTADRLRGGFKESGKKCKFVRLLSTIAVIFVGKREILITCHD